MRKKVFILFFHYLVICLIFVIPNTVLATNKTPFEISPILPDNQNPDVTSYYDIKVSPNEKITLSTFVKNNLDKPIVAVLTPLNATTSSIGDIVYDVNGKKQQFLNLKVKLNNIAPMKTSIEIPANSSISIPIEFQLPSENTGIVIGGIHVIADGTALSETEFMEGNATFNIKNQIAYVIGIKMQFPTLVDPEFSFGKARVDLQYGEPKLFIEMKNSAPAVVKDLSGTYKVSDEDGKQVLEGTFSDMKMAPNTRFEYAVNWVDGKVKPGKYNVKLTAIVDGKDYKAQKNFVIKETKPINDFNKEAKEKADNDGVNLAIPWWGYALSVATVGMIFFFIGRKSKKKKYKRQDFEFLHKTDDKEG
jgi:hypothetical protein